MANKTQSQNANPGVLTPGLVLLFINQQRNFQSDQVWENWTEISSKNFAKCYHFLIAFFKRVLLKKNVCEVAQSCQTLCYPMEYNPPGSSVHGIFQARILEWVAISFSRGSSQPRDWTQVSCIVGRCFNLWAKNSEWICTYPWLSVPFQGHGCKSIADRTCFSNFGKK